MKSVNDRKEDLKNKLEELVMVKIKYNKDYERDKEDLRDCVEAVKKYFEENIDNFKKGIDDLYRYLGKRRKKVLKEKLHINGQVLKLPLGDECDLEKLKELMREEFKLENVRNFLKEVSKVTGGEREDKKRKKGALWSFILFLKDPKIGLFLGGSEVEDFFGKHLVGSDTPEIEKTSMIFEGIRNLVNEGKLENAIEARYYIVKWYQDKNSVRNLTREVDEMSMLSKYFKERGFSFKEHQIASFYTALKTKGFVILAGLSGTGKTKMAQLFGELFSLPIAVVVGYTGKANVKIRKDPPFLYYWDETGIYPLDKGREFLKQKENYPVFFLYVDSNSSEIKYVMLLEKGWVVEKDNSLEIIKEIEQEEDLWEKERKCVKFLEDYEDEDKKKRSLDDIVKNSRVLFKVSKIMEIHDNKLRYKDLFELGVELHLQVVFPERYKFKFREFFLKYLSSFNPTFFLPVRPDWKDSKSLLGFYNPLNERFEPEPAFKFILKAIADYKKHKENASPHFIILDEMNLAHVAYYFSDFLSVLESGRDGDDGFTKEGIKVKIGSPEKNPDENAEIINLLKEAQLPTDRDEIEVKLPPNLYIIGTVNIDETTFMFSPKVLDRAFTIEFNEVDFNKYMESIKGKTENSHKDFNIHEIIKDFTSGGEFLKACGNKEYMKKVLGELNTEKDEIIGDIRTLNEILIIHNLHFAYRVFDEILLFYHNANSAKNIVYFNDDNEILDLAVMMKVLPKFHGNRAKLEIPLLKVVNWTLKERLNEKDNNELRKKVWKIVAGNSEEIIPESISKVLETLEEGKFKYPHTARKVLRMLYQLYTDGYASFI